MSQLIEHFHYFLTVGMGERSCGPLFDITVMKTTTTTLITYQEQRKKRIPVPSLITLLLSASANDCKVSTSLLLKSEVPPTHKKFSIARCVRVGVQNLDVLPLNSTPHPSSLAIPDALFSKRLSKICPSAQQQLSNHEVFSKRLSKICPSPQQQLSNHEDLILYAFSILSLFLLVFFNPQDYESCLSQQGT